MKKNIVVVGCGYWGKNLVRNFHELDALYGVSDPQTEISELYSKKYSVKSLSFNESLKDKNVDAVAICAPAELHKKLIIEALLNGKNVFVEKPLALSLNECDEIEEALTSSKKFLMVGHLLHYHPIFSKVKKLIKSNEIGKVLKIHSERKSFGKIRNNEDVIWSFAPHDISMILSLADSMPDDIKVSGNYFLDQKIYDSANINLTFKGNLSAQIDVSWLHPVKRHCLTIIGEKGMIVFDDTNDWPEKLFLRKHSLNNELALNSADKFIEVPYGEPLKIECSHFLDLLDGNVENITDFNEGKKVVSVLCRCS